MHRRAFTLGLSATSLLLVSAHAAGEPVQGKDYTTLSSPVPTTAGGKIEVIEFFGYWCPHCRALEAKLEAWVKKLPGDVVFRRVPVAWQRPQEPYQRIYFALEALGVAQEVHGKVFDALHVQGLRLDTDAGIAAFAAANGLDKTKLLDAMNSFAVASKVRTANQTWKAYGIEGVPTLAVNGRYLTSPAQTGSDERALEVADALIAKVRATR
ncbi:MAG TPA: thiol:disulfide interchange protein DsbA/DsbL [Rubrivivax sp.]|nr:thiol:disulfide interchange protein DsbA/DsbL [Pseudomonadota bacterium]HOL37598.1 thiol:disulfide interchange protein DsbA/DsbL [Rubrivivax sp.]HPP82610.1 thiol:disulfide interchange protein DsbA/DsbL [Rubrivivax sp.]